MNNELARGDCRDIFLSHAVRREAHNARPFGALAQSARQTCDMVAVSCRTNYNLVSGGVERVGVTAPSTELGRMVTTGPIPKFLSISA